MIIENIRTLLVAVELVNLAGHHCGTFSWNNKCHRDLRLRRFGDKLLSADKPIQIWVEFLEKKLTVETNLALHGEICEKELSMFLISCSMSNFYHGP